ncbi:MAG: TldD/PmbA family protein [Oscillospiraceae bacterium]|nr:TldD/PmbA family protein [Oscillospiraceae bacterium]
MNLHDLAALRPLIPGCGEIRLHKNSTGRVDMLNGDVTANAVSDTMGVSARVLRGRSWGLASAPEATPESVKAVLQAASDNAALLHGRAGGEPLPLRDAPAAKGKWSHATARPRAARKDKLDFLAALDAYTLKACPGLISRRFILNGFDQEKTLVTGGGAECYSFIPRMHVYMFFTTEKDGAPIDLMAPTYGGLGEFEDFFGDPADYYGKIDAFYEELMKKREGVYAEAGLKECVLAPDLAGILAHEAVGHTVEADLVMGGSVAGDLLNRRVASDLVSITDFAHTAMGETCPVPVYFDDEGVAARDAALIENGILTGYMHNRESAARYGAEPAGNARAFAFGDEPLIRMRNTCILPGASKLEDMIASVEDGYFLKNPANGQADMTSEFMFAVEMGYEIKKGRLGRAILNTTVSGVAFEMLKTVTAVSDGVHWVSSGFCGKKQYASVGMGGPAVQCKINIGGR